MIRFLSAVALIFALTLPVQATDSDHLITPNGGIGKVTLGMSKDDVVKDIGKPRTTIHINQSECSNICSGHGGDVLWYEIENPQPDGSAKIVWGGRIVAIDSDTSKVIASGVLFEGPYETKDGLHTFTMRNGHRVGDGSMYKDVVNALGEPDHVYHLTCTYCGDRMVYTKLGIEFVTSDRREVFRIDVFRAYGA